MTDQERDELLARVTALEHLLEIGYATWLAQMTPEEFREFDRHFEERLRVTWPLSIECFGHTEEIPEEIVREAQALAARFRKRARDKGGEIRAARSDNVS